MSDTRVDAINKQYRQRETNLAAARGLDAPDFDAVEAENVVEDKPDPTVESKKADIIDWLFANGVEAEREDLEKMTRAQLFENFVDDDS
jgi:hypothetical protein